MAYNKVGSASMELIQKQQEEKYYNVAKT